MSTRRLGVILATAGLCVVLAACKTTPPPKPTGRLLSGEELAALYMTGKPVVSSGFVRKDGTDFWMERDGKGNQTLRIPSSGYEDSGTYRLEGTTVCSRWNQVWDGEERCYRIYALPDGRYESDTVNGEKYATFTVKPAS